MLDVVSCFLYSLCLSIKCVDEASSSSSHLSSFQATYHSLHQTRNTTRFPSWETSLFLSNPRIKSKLILHLEYICLIYYHFYHFYHFVLEWNQVTNWYTLSGHRSRLHQNFVSDKKSSPVFAFRPFLTWFLCHFSLILVIHVVKQKCLQDMKKQNKETKENQNQMNVVGQLYSFLIPVKSTTVNHDFDDSYSPICFWIIVANLWEMLREVSSKTIILNNAFNHGM
jgi:hypothetical protein